MPAWYLKILNKPAEGSLDSHPFGISRVVIAQWLPVAGLGDPAAGVEELRDSGRELLGVADALAALGADRGFSGHTRELALAASRTARELVLALCDQLRLSGAPRAAPAAVSVTPGVPVEVNFRRAIGRVLAAVAVAPDALLQLAQRLAAMVEILRRACALEVERAGLSS